MNSGTASVAISQLNNSDKNFFISTQEQLPVTVAAGATYTFEVYFSPASAGAFSGQLTVMDTAASPIAQVSMSGSGVEPATPQITVAPSSFSFGSVPLNSESTQTLTLISTGTAAVTVTSATLTGAGFSMSGGTFPATLDLGMTLTLSVQFAPTASGAVNGQLTVSSNSSSGATTTVALSGTGTNAAKPQLTISPSSLSFGGVADNSKSTETVTLSSTGSAPVIISSGTLTGTGFTMSGATFPVTLNPNLAIALDVQFAPTTTGAFAGHITVVSNSSSGSTSVVAISGTGTAVQHEVDLSWSAPASSMDAVAGYNIYRSPGTSTAYQKLDSSLDTQTSYVDVTVQSGSSYTYIVKSVDLAGIESAPSNPLSVTIP